MENVRFQTVCGNHVLDAVDIDSRVINSKYDEGFECTVVRFRIDGVVFEAVEDPEDGYRSSMWGFSVSHASMKNVFQPIEIIVSTDKNGYILRFVDVITKKEIFYVGTDNYDDYYPCFVYSFMPENMRLNQNK